MKNIKRFVPILTIGFVIAITVGLTACSKSSSGGGGGGTTPIKPTPPVKTDVTNTITV
jgi:hypothetical protein